MDRGGGGLVVGVISDTHGLLRAEVLAALAGVDHVVHAGDVGDRKVLEGLEAIAPWTAVRGNVDGGSLARELPATAVVELGGHALYVLHDLDDLDVDPAASGFSAVVSGHTHVPRVEWKQRVLYLNPGSAGPHRFRLPVAIAKITIAGGRLEPRLLVLSR